MNLSDFATLEERTLLISSVHEMGTAGHLTASIIARDTSLSENCVLGYGICLETHVNMLYFLAFLACVDLHVHFSFYRIRILNRNPNGNDLLLSDFDGLEERVALVAAVIALSESTSMTLNDICDDTGLSWSCVRG